MTSDKQRLYVGSASSGVISSFDPATNLWESIVLQGSDTITVEAIGMWGADLVVYLLPKDLDSEAARGTWVIQRVSVQSQQQEIIGNGWPTTYPTIHSFVEYDSTLYGATYENGLWKRGLHDSVWTETTRPLDEELQILDKMPRGMAVYRDSMWNGYNAGPIFQTANGATWRAKRNCMTTNGCFDAPYSTFALLSYRDRLFAAGKGTASPVEWDPDSSKWVPILNETWCRTVDGKSECGGSTTWDLAAIGDTLYACGNARIMKMPLSDLPKRGRWTP